MGLGEDFEGGGNRLADLYVYPPVVQDQQPFELGNGQVTIHAIVIGQGLKSEYLRQVIIITVDHLNHFPYLLLVLGRFQQLAQILSPYDFVGRYLTEYHATVYLHKLRFTLWDQVYQATHQLYGCLF